MLSILHNDWTADDADGNPSIHPKNIKWTELVNIMSKKKMNTAADLKCVRFGTMVPLPSGKRRRSKNKISPNMSPITDQSSPTTDKRIKHKKHRRRRSTKQPSNDKNRKITQKRHSKTLENPKKKVVRQRNGGMFDNSLFLMKMQLWDNEYVSNCRITLSRNIHGFRFENYIHRAERRKIEKIISTVLLSIETGDLRGKYKEYSKINVKKIPIMIETDKLFPKPDTPSLILAGYTRDWPESRGVFINYKKNLYMWVNYLEHLHMIAVQNDGNILLAFKRLFQSEKQLFLLFLFKKKIKFLIEIFYFCKILDSDFFLFGFLEKNFTFFKFSEIFLNFFSHFFIFLPDWKMQ